MATMKNMFESDPEYNHPDRISARHYGNLADQHRDLAEVHYAEKDKHPKFSTMRVLHEKLAKHHREMSDAYVQLGSLHHTQWYASKKG